VKRFQTMSVVISLEEIAEGIYVLTLECPEIAKLTEPGQFVNVRMHDAHSEPLLRRPFSVSFVEGDRLELLFNVIGTGTRFLSTRRPGDAVDLLGPLGVPFHIDDTFETALLLAGGVGVAPFPMLRAALERAGKKVITLLGARSGVQIADRRLNNAYVATDDGSRGFHGSVVDLFHATVARNAILRPKIFACGPNRMLSVVAAAARTIGMDCELSLEGEMACGIGICQGCPVERSREGRKYALVCTDGPTFNSRDVVI